MTSAYLMILRGDKLENIDSYSTIYVILFLLLITIFVIYKFKTHTVPINLLYFVAFFSIFPILLFSDSLNLFFKAIIYSWLFILMFRYGYCLGYYDEQLPFKINSLLIISMAVLLPLNIDGYIINSSTNFLISNDAIFSLAALTPIPILLKNKKIAYLLLSFIVVLALFSLKRSVIGGVILSVALGTMIIVMNNKKGYLIIIAIILVLICGQITLKNTPVGYAIMNRFEQGDSGRSDMHSEIFNHISHSFFPEIIFGHGYGGTTKILGMPAHNDFIDIFYNYGIIYFILYSFIVLLFIYKCFAWYKYKNYFLKYYVSFVMSIVLLIFLSMFNCIITSMYGNIIFFTIGISYGKIRCQLVSIYKNKNLKL